MSCEYGYLNCCAKKCDLCIDGNFFDEIKVKSQSIKYAKSNGRKGSQFEADNHNKNAELLSGASTRLTPNSGAGNIKGDEEIRGLLSIMEELKERDGHNSSGQYTFNMEKSWFDKLEREGKEAHKDFWYLKFKFAKDDKIYVASDYDMFMSIINTMNSDRIDKIKSEMEVKTFKSVSALKDKEILSYLSEIDKLKAKITLLNNIINLNKFMEENNL